MKKQILAGIVVLLVMFVVTCDVFQPVEGDKVEYTDVVYSDDGSTVTLYLDGVGVPVTKSQRAITRDLAKMAYDYFEVIFIARTDPVGTGPATPIVARAQWELGQSAGISGVYRGNVTSGGADYLWNWDAAAVSPAPNHVAQTDRIALMFLGRKDDKTLLGIGRLAEVDHSATTAPTDAALKLAKASNNKYPFVVPIPPATGPVTGFVTGTDDTPTPTGKGLPVTPYAFILPTSTSVTFYVEAVKTGLLIGAETEGDGNNDINAQTDSFQYTGPNDASDPDELEDWDSREGHSHRQAPASGSKALYPIYYLPEDKGAVQHAEYKFKGAADTFQKEILFSAAPTKVGNVIIPPAITPVTGHVPDKGIAIEKRFPRYLEGGRYRQLKENVDTDTTVELDTVTANLAGTPAVPNPYKGLVAKDTAFIPTIPLKFTTLGTGVLSFFLEIPVYMITKDPGTNNGALLPITWKLRTGLGSELYSLDTGKSSGGCVLLGIGEIDLDWLEIFWQWLDE